MFLYTLFIADLCTLNIFYLTKGINTEIKLNTLSIFPWSSDLYISSTPSTILNHSFHSI